MFHRAANEKRVGAIASRCAMCGAGILGGRERTLNLLCLICRAAILDRIFQARRQQMYAVKHR